MSGRIRSVKPEWLEDELLALASDAARVLSIGLMLQADDYGNGRANPILLAGQVFPGKVLEHTANALEELRSIRFVVLYEVEGQRYFSIRNWDKHQRVDKPGKPRVPGPPSEKPAITESNQTLAKVPESPSNIPDAAANPRASRASDRGPDPDPDRDPDRDPDPDRSRVSVVVPQPPRSLEQALQVSIGPRSQFVVDRPDMAQWLNPERWPEVREVAQSLHTALGIGPPRLLGYSSDRGVRGVVELFAAGYTVDELKLVCERAPKEPWWGKEGASRGLSTLTAEVVRRALASAAPTSGAEVSPRVAKILADRAARKASEIGAAS